MYRDDVQLSCHCEIRQEALQKENIRLADKSSTLEGEVKFLQEKTVSLEEKIVTLEDKITSLEQDQRSTEQTEITRPCPEDSGGIDESRIASQPKDGAKKISKRVDTTTESIVAFHAILTQTITNPTSGHIIQFGKTVTNIGSHYNSQNGEFVCPEVGVYKFSWTIHVHQGQYMTTELVRNGVVIGSGISGADTYFTTGSASAITMLVPGDSVWLRVLYHDSGSSIYPNFTIFNGFRLH
ncbi:C1q-related factor-like [Argopecten irradians]|uniref:C1q-related factor-like n=1 Tax=Argopecten irradians TaxID=31199 RepID=UPI003723F58A